ncbi:rhotekin-like isoform X2 [Numida meleagris]|uniref:rhotekin-like isoform X2 n=1 Tax=Numida meleagris TaxID=8996 RepID=UPI000B3E29E8|nr:rhotekin-like isoform X2 [Numida meleagris]
MSVGPVAALWGGWCVCGVVASVGHVALWEPAPCPRGTRRIRGARGSAVGCPRGGSGPVPGCSAMRGPWGAAVRVRSSGLGWEGSPEGPPNPGPTATPSPPPQDTDIQKKIDHEIRMREGACKLLAACTQREQALEATKSLQVCNSRILAYMAELQRMKEAQVMQRAARRPSDAGPAEERLPCRGKVCVSDLRIPLMWKDTEYFRNKGELHRCAVFCLLQLGVEIYDTEMVLVDRTLTDICFESAVLFSEAGPDFLLKVELYSAGLGEEAGGSAPRKLASKLSSSLGRTAGRRLRAAMDGGPGSPTANGGGALLLPAPSVP